MNKNYGCLHQAAILAGSPFQAMEDSSQFSTPSSSGRLTLLSKHGADGYQGKIGVDIESCNVPGSGQFDHGPVVPGHSFPAAFPSVHPFAAVGIFISYKNSPAGFNEIFLFREVVGGI